MRLNNLVDTLEQCADAFTDRPAFEWSPDDVSERKVLTYGGLRERARRLAAALRRHHETGSRVLLLFPPGLEFIEAFFGCVYSGLVAVPVCPPRRFRRERRMEGIIENAKPAVVLSTAELTQNRQAWFAGIPALIRSPWLAVDSMAPNADTDCIEPQLDESTTALLQYTSGTTGSPKGVIVSHGNLAHNATTIRRAFGPGDHPRRAFWLPMYHDMGLIGAMLQTVFDGATSAWLSPTDFLQRPLRWLELISKSRASVSGAPDFAYNYCVEQSTPSQRSGIDLSLWTVAVSGAETIRPATIERFSAAFAECGFRREAFQPGYGLAEATLVVSHELNHVVPTTVCINRLAISQNSVVSCARDAPDARLVASSGVVGAEQDVAIVDGETELPCSEGSIGEIWVSGPNVAQGYYDRPEATLATFQAELPGDTRRFLRTGDLGFFLDGHLYVTGRKKELVVIRGRNVYPQDLEWAVRQSDVRVRGAANAVFSVEMLGAERLVVVQEVGRAHRKTDFDDLGHVVRREIARESGAEVFDLLFVRDRSIPRTTSGKVRRLQCREDYLAERFDPLARWTERHDRPFDPLQTEHSLQATPSRDATVLRCGESVSPRSSSDIHQWLMQRIAQRLDIVPADLNDQQAFSEMGLGSLDIVLICVDFEQWLGQRMPPTMIFNYPTIATLSEHLGQPAEPTILSYAESSDNDTLRVEVAQCSDSELELFIAEQMMNTSRTTGRRAA